MSTEILDNLLGKLSGSYSWPQGKTLVIAISGGPDSTCAMRVIHEIALQKGFKLHLAHLDHCLRGEESNKDAEFVKELANKYKWDYTIKKANIKLMYQESGGSMQQICRDVRQQFLLRVAKKVDAFGIAFGHNKGDQAETILQHLIRGSGLTGLTGMKIIEKSVNNLAIIRPLLEKTREEILEILEHYQLTYRQDASNATDKYQRNHIRHNLIPFIEEHYNPQFVDRLANMAGILNEDENYIEQQALGLAYKALKEEDNTVIITCDQLVNKHNALCTRVLRHAYRLLTGTTENLTYEHSLKLNKLVYSHHGDSVSLPKNVTCEKVYDKLYLYYKDKLRESSNFSSIIKEGDSEIILPNKQKLLITLESYDQAKTYKRELLDEVFFDLSKITLPLTVRTRQNGDRFFPDGAPGKKKLKDFFIDKKIPRNSRNHYVLIVDNSGKILWVVGLRRSQYAKVTPKTEKVLALRIMEGE